MKKLWILFYLTAALGLTLARPVAAVPFFMGLGDLPGGGFLSQANGVSTDGLVVVGESLSDSGIEAFRWTQETAMIGLGDLPGGFFSSTAFSAYLHDELQRWLEEARSHVQSLD